MRWWVSSAVAVVVLDQLLLWVERKGWLYYRKRRPTGGNPAAIMFLELTGQYDPSRVRVQEQRVESATIRKTQADSDPFTPGDYVLRIPRR